MKRQKLFGVAVAAICALVALPASAAATVVTAPTGTAYTETISLRQENEIVLEGFGNLICNFSEIDAKVESHGSTVTATGPITALSFTACNHHVEVLAKGSFSIHALGGGNGTLTLSGARIKVVTTLFQNVTCVFETKDTDLGEITAAVNDSANATLDVEFAPLSIDAANSNPFCKGGSLSTSYKAVTPKGLLFD
ncbi:MAG TPA: hypothetical protein VFY75_07425 [Solirubrobacterales bacterium]|nr:hypothetical protein [Solirubrobacterales bacterium]